MQNDKRLIYIYFRNLKHIMKCHDALDGNLYEVCLDIENNNQIGTKLFTEILLIRVMRSVNKILGTLTFIA